MGNNLRGRIKHEDGIIEVYDDDNSALCAGAASAAYTGNILELTNFGATDYNFIKFSNDLYPQEEHSNSEWMIRQVFITSTSQSTSTTTGSFQTTGGAGVAKTLYVGQGGFVIRSSTTGSVIVAGGLGVAGTYTAVVWL